MWQYAHSAAVDRLQRIAALVANPCGDHARVMAQQTLPAQPQPQVRIELSVDPIMFLLLLFGIEQLAIDAVALALEFIKGNEA
jgi:hypothetical protein